MAARVAINGFGRIGRITLRIIATGGWPVDVVAINDPFLPAETAAHLLRYDTVYRRAPFPVHVEGEALVVDGRKIPFLVEKEPGSLPGRSTGWTWSSSRAGCSRIPTRRRRTSRRARSGSSSPPPSGPRKGEVLQILWRVNEGQFAERGSRRSCPLPPALRTRSGRW